MLFRSTCGTYISGNYQIGNSSTPSFNFRFAVDSYGRSASTPSNGVLLDGNLNLQAAGYINAFQLSPNFTFDTSAGRIVKGFYYNPTLTTIKAGDKHYGIHTTSGGVYINTTSLQDSACLQADSTTQGFLPPRMTDAQVRAIATPAVGLMAYNTDLDCPVFYSAAGWRKVSHSAM